MNGIEYLCNKIETHVAFIYLKKLLNQHWLKSKIIYTVQIVKTDVQNYLHCENPLLICTQIFSSLKDHLRLDNKKYIFVVVFIQGSNLLYMWCILKS